MLTGHTMETPRPPQVSISGSIVVEGQLTAPDSPTVETAPLPPPAARWKFLCRWKDFQKVTAYATLLLATGTVVLAGGTIWLACLSQRQLKEFRGQELRELRAYVSASLTPIKYPPDAPNRFAISLDITNGGKTWARKLILRTAIVKKNVDWQSANWHTSGPMVFGPSQTLHLQFAEVPFDDLKTIEKNDAGPNYFISVQYGDVVSDKPVSWYTQLAAHLRADTEPPGPGHVSLAYFPTHNCADTDCPADSVSLHQLGGDTSPFNLGDPLYSRQPPLGRLGNYSCTVRVFATPNGPAAPGAN